MRLTTRPFPEWWLGLSARSPTLNLSQNTDTGDRCLQNASPDNELSDELSTGFTVEIFSV